VETATDNPTRTVANVRSYFNRFNGSLGTSGSVDYMFEHKCQFRIKNKENLILEEFELEMIDYGGQEIFTEEDNIMIYAEFESFGPIQKYFEENGFEIVSAEFERIPTDQKELNAEQTADVEKLLARLEEDDDVTNVYHTMK
jgi:transcriptional/translational regulatory protein YebC/TACO1